MSAVSDVLAYLETQVTTLLPTVVAMPFMYSPEDNNRLADHCYALRVGSASQADGVNRHLTLDHSFNIDLSRKYGQKKTLGDADLREKINLLYDDVQTVYKALSRRTGTAGDTLMLIISPVDVSEPAVDNSNNLVTVTLTLNVKYRVAT